MWEYSLSANVDGSVQVQLFPVGFKGNRTVLDSTKSRKRMGVVLGWVRVQSETLLELTVAETGEVVQTMAGMVHNGLRSWIHHQTINSLPKQ